MGWLAEDRCYNEIHPHVCGKAVLQGPKIIDFSHVEGNLDPDFRTWRQQEKTSFEGKSYLKEPHIQNLFKREAETRESKNVYGCPNLCALYS